MEGEKETLEVCGLSNGPKVFPFKALFLVLHAILDKIKGDLEQLIQWQLTMLNINHLKTPGFHIIAF